jgi:hypothetical protein
LAPSSSSGSGKQRWVFQLDKLALVSMTLGLLLYVMPFWAEGRLLFAFWLTFAATVLHIYTSHAGGAV